MGCVGPEQTPSAEALLAFVRLVLAKVPAARSGTLRGAGAGCISESWLPVCCDGCLLYPARPCWARCAVLVGPVPLLGFSFSLLQLGP